MYNIGEELTVTSDYRTYSKGDSFVFYGDSSKEGCAKGYHNGRKLMKFIPYELLKSKEETKMTKKTDELKQSKEDLKIGFDWEPKKKEIKEGMLIKYNCLGEIIYGVTEAKTNFGDKPGWHCYWSNDEGKSTPWCFEDSILEAWDIVAHKPQEDNLSVAQESANFAHAAVQGIINAHAEKNSDDRPLLSRLEDLEAFTFDKFDLSVARTWKKQDFKDAVSNAALGLTGEAGEVADLIKKAIYHGRGFSLKDNPKAIAKYDVKDELSDVLFYLSAMAQEFGFTLEDVAKHNKEKLEKRFPEGFSTEASAHKVDKREGKFPFKAKVIGDRDGNPTGYHHGLDYGTIVTVTGENFSKCYIADSLTIFQDDLEEVKN